MKPDADSRQIKQVVRRGYDRVVEAYARLEGDAAWPRLRWLDKVLARLAPGAAVLDLGCGAGEPADVAIARRHRPFGADISRQQLRRARRHVPAGAFLQADAGAVAFASASFDAVVSFYTMEHIPRREHPATFMRIHRWLRPGGLLLLSMEAADADDVMGEWLGVPMFFSCYDPETTRQLVRAAGFTLLETAIEVQVEQGTEIPYHWLLARKA